MRETSPVLWGLVIGDDGVAWRAAGFHVEDGGVTVGGVRLRLTGADGGRGVLGWALTPAAPRWCDGLAAADDADLGAPSPEAERGTSPAHPNGAVALDHVVVATDDVERTTAALAVAGMTPRRSVVGARGDGDDLAYRFFLLGTCVLELVGPTATNGGGGARFAGLAFSTEALDDLGELAGTPRAAVQPGRRIATLRTRELGISVPVAMLTPRPRSGG